MVASIVVGMLVLIIIFVVYREYRNEKRYQEKKQREKERRRKKFTPKVTQRPSGATPKPAEGPHPKNLQKSQTPPPSVKTVKTIPETETRSVPEQTQKPSVELPKGEYPDFNYERLLEMGLSEDEAQTFIHELIPQIREQILRLEEALKIPDFQQMEHLTHTIKGSSTTIGTGGVSDLLVEYNTYLKTGKELPIAKAYQALLKKYFAKLEKQFPAEG